MSADDEARRRMTPRARLRAWFDDMQLSNRLGTPHYANPSELKADIRALAATLDSAVKRAETLEGRLDACTVSKNQAHKRAQAAETARDDAIRERDTLDVAILEYAEVTGTLIHSWPDDERERKRESLYADVKFMQSALDDQSDNIEALKAERDDAIAALVSERVERRRLERVLQRMADSMQATGTTTTAEEDLQWVPTFGPLAQDLARETLASSLDSERIE